jgi:hypothetical protein
MRVDGGPMPAGVLGEMLRREGVRALRMPGDGDIAARHAGARRGGARRVPRSYRAMVDADAGLGLRQSRLTWIARTTIDRIIDSAPDGTVTAQADGARS